MVNGRPAYPGMNLVQVVQIYSTAEEGRHDSVAGPQRARAQGLQQLQQTYQSSNFTLLYHRYFNGFSKPTKVPYLYC